MVIYFGIGGLYGIMDTSEDVSFNIIMYNGMVNNGFICPCIQSYYGIWIMSHNWLLMAYMAYMAYMVYGLWFLLIYWL